MTRRGPVCQTDRTRTAERQDRLVLQHSQVGEKFASLPWIAAAKNRTNHTPQAQLDDRSRLSHFRLVSASSPERHTARPKEQVAKSQKYDYSQGESGPCVVRRTGEKKSEKGRQTKDDMEHIHTHADSQDGHCQSIGLRNEVPETLGRLRIKFSVRVRQETRLYYYIRTDGPEKLE